MRATSLVRFVASLAFMTIMTACSGRFSNQVVNIETSTGSTQNQDPLQPNVGLPQAFALLPAFGVATHLYQANDPGHPISTERNSQFPIDLGATTMRLDITWSSVETVAGIYNFSAYDPLVAAWRSSGIRPLLLLAYGNTLYTAAWNDPPRSASQLAAWSNFCRAVATHYTGADIKFEIWNEPNLPTYWLGGVNAVEYVRVLDAASSAIRQVQPQAYIATAGLSPSGSDPNQFITQIVSNADMTKISGLSYHFYTTGDWAPWDPSGWNSTDANAASRPEATIATLASLKAAAGSFAGKVDFLNTESGFPLPFAKNNSESRQAILMSRLLLTSLFTDLKTMIIYDLISDGTTSTDNEQTFGLYRFDFSRKPSGDAFVNVTKSLNGALSITTKQDGSSYEITALKADRTTKIVWTTSPSATRLIEVSASITNVIARDVFGKNFAKSRTASGVMLTLTEAGGPVIIDLYP